MQLHEMEWKSNAMNWSGMACNGNRMGQKNEAHKKYSNFGINNYLRLEDVRLQSRLLVHGNYKRIYPIVPRLPTDCLETASGLPLDCKRPALALPGGCLGIASGLLLDCKRLAFAFPGVCLGIAQ